MATRKRRKRIPLRHSEGDFTPVHNWMERNGSIPNGKVIVFDGNGNNVSLKDIRCGRTYYTMCRRYKRVRACPAAATVGLLVRLTNSAAWQAAKRVRRRCWSKPSCQSEIMLQAAAWGCRGFAQFDGGEAHAGHCYRIECFTL